MAEKDNKKEEKQSSEEIIENDNEVNDDEIEMNETADEAEAIEQSHEASNESLAERVKQLQEENEQLTDRLLRVQAEYENYRKRTEKERVAERKYQAQDLATDLLPVIDNFERALQTEVSEENKGFHEGVQMVYDQFMQALKSHGIEAMEVVNEPFDPNLHHAVMQEENDSVESNTVIEELQKGFLLKDKVIRPAMVKVNK